MEQTAFAIIGVFTLLAVILFKFGKPARAGSGWLGRFAAKSPSRRIAHIESRILPGGCTLHLVKVDAREFLLAQSGSSCSSVGSWNGNSPGEKQ